MLVLSFAAPNDVFAVENNHVFKNSAHNDTLYGQAGAINLLGIEPVPNIADAPAFDGFFNDIPDLGEGSDFSEFFNDLSNNTNLNQNFPETVDNLINPQIINDALANVEDTEAALTTNSTVNRAVLRATEELRNALENIQNTGTTIRNIQALEDALANTPAIQSALANIPNTDSILSSFEQLTSAVANLSNGQATLNGLTSANDLLTSLPDVDALFNIIPDVDAFTLSGNYEIFPPVSPDIVPCSTSCPACLPCTIITPLTHQIIKVANGFFFRQHRDWLIDEFFTNHIRYAMTLMTNQMTNVSMQQVKIIGSFFDAKHQLETQRLFQQLMAQAHKDYQPSQGMCDIGTSARGLVASERKTNLTQQVLARRVLDREMRSGDNLTQTLNSDLYSRLDLFKKNFCHQNDNANNLNHLCIDGNAPQATINKDVDFTRTVDSQLTLNLDFSNNGGGEANGDEKAAFALMTNLFANKIIQGIGDRVLANGNGDPNANAHKYMNLRAVAAKRSVAQNSMTAIIAERAAGNEETGHAPFVKAALLELGVASEEIGFLLGVNPSYFAQMEVLTKKLYQNPVFYTELYDKPTNVLRKRASIRAIGLMQDRDYFKSQLRSEAVLSVILESMLNEEHDRVYSQLNKLAK